MFWCFCACVFRMCFVLGIVLLIQSHVLACHWPSWNDLLDLSRMMQSLWLHGSIIICLGVIWAISKWIDKHRTWQNEEPLQALSSSHNNETYCKEVPYFKTNPNVTWQRPGESTSRSTGFSELSAWAVWAFGPAVRKPQGSSCSSPRRWPCMDVIGSNLSPSWDFEIAMFLCVFVWLFFSSAS